MIGSLPKRLSLKWFALCGTLVASGTLVSSAAIADNLWRPTARHYALSARGEDCSIYSTLATRTRINLSESEQRLAASVEELKRRRTALESCAREKGLGTLGTDSSEMNAARLCPFEFHEWLQPAFHMEAAQQEVDEAQGQLETLTLLLRKKCPIVTVNSPF